jgi:hypothetical protein
MAGIEENENGTVGMTDELQSKIEQEEPIDTGIAESSEPRVESEDQDRFELV